MSSIIQDKLAEYAQKLKEYNRQAIKAIVEWDIEALAIIVSDYISLKKSIRISKIDFHIINIPDKEVKDIYEKVFSDKLEIDKLIKSIDSEEPIEDLNDDEIESLSDLLYAKFSNYEYVRNLYEIKRIYKYESDVIHGKKVVNRLEAKNMFHDTLDVIQKLYSKYEPTSLAPKPLSFKR